MTTPSSAELAALANRARAEASCPDPIVTARHLAKLWETTAMVAAYAAMLAARLETLEARPRAGRPPKSKD